MDKPGAEAQALGLDFDRHLNLKEQKAELLEEHARYLSQHPEIKNVLQDFVSELLLKAPEDVFEFASSYFSTFSTKPVAPKLPVFVVTGPSGVGKGTLISRLMGEFSGLFGFSCSYTTRHPRPGEREGIEYHFVTAGDMHEAIERGEFIEHATVHGAEYGTTFAEVKKVSESKRICLLDIDVQGANLLKKSSIYCKYFFVAPPSLQQLEERLRKRKTETEEALQTRMANAKAEMSMMDTPGFFDHIIVNDDLDRAYSDLRSIALPYILQCKQAQGQST